MDKATLRKQYRAVRAGRSAQARQFESQAVVANLLKHPAIVSAPLIFCYVSCGSEVDTHGLMEHCWNTGRTLAAPRLTGRNNMLAVPVRGWHELEADAQRPGLLIPKADLPEVTASLKATTVTIVPGLAFTLQGDRLGQGGGCYDRYLNDHPETVSLALAFDDQIVDALPSEPHDRRVDWIITPTRVIACQKT